METVQIGNAGTERDFATAREAAQAFAEERLGEVICMSWYDRAKDQESPAHASDCHGSCEVPGYVEYAESRGAELTVVVDDGAYVFCFRSLGEFSDALGGG